MAWLRSSKPDLVGWFANFLAAHEHVMGVIDERDLRYSKGELLDAFAAEIRSEGRSAAAGLPGAGRRLDLLKSVGFRLQNDVHQLSPEDRAAYDKYRKFTRAQVEALVERVETDPTAEAVLQEILGMSLKYRPASRSLDTAPV